MAQSKITDLLKQRMGLDAASIGQATVDRAVRLRMALCGAHRVEDYWQRVSTSDEELQELIEAVVVPETWFFRHQESFAALIRLVTNEWLPAHSSGVLRALSIPCSSGEEPYSIAMALLDAGLAPERFEVDGMDISMRGLALARRAVYGKNSFRGQGLSFRERYFDLTPDGHQLAESVRERVRFQHSNILTLDSRPGMNLYDVVFCRNMLIYFDQPAQEIIMQKLDHLLTPKGVLFAGPAEAFSMRGRGFIPIRHPGAFAFRKSNPQAGEPLLPGQRLPRKTITANGRQAGPPRAAKPAAQRVVKPASPPTSPKVPAQITESPATSSPDLETISQLADAGRLTEAAAMCEAHLKEQGPASRAYYLLGIVRDALGQQQEAAAYYRKVLYLDSDHAEALMHLALVLEKQGDAAGARRLRERARRVEERVKQ